jgi:hypothetical protein
MGVKRHAATLHLQLMVDSYSHSIKVADRQEVQSASIELGSQERSKFYLYYNASNIFSP